MKTNWIRTVNDINKKRYVVPAGWETKDEVAVSLQCDADKVTDLLKPGIVSGDIEKQDFSVWDEKRRLAVRVTCYRLADRSDKKTPEVVDDYTPKPTAAGRLSMHDRIEIAIKRYPYKTNREISKMVNKARSSDVQLVRDRM
jgi:hypothetical protein